MRRAEPVVSGQGHAAREVHLQGMRPGSTVALIARPAVTPLPSSQALPMASALRPPHAVKSVSQRKPVINWQALYAKQGLPGFDDMTPGERAHDPRRVLVWAGDRSSGERTYRHL